VDGGAFGQVVVEDGLHAPADSDGVDADLVDTAQLLDPLSDEPGEFVAVVALDLVEDRHAPAPVEGDDGVVAGDGQTDVDAEDHLAVLLLEVRVAVHRHEHSSEVEQAVFADVGEAGEDLGLPAGVGFAPAHAGVVDPLLLEEVGAGPLGHVLAGEVGGVESGYGDEVPAPVFGGFLGFLAPDLGHVGAGVVGVGDGEDAGVGVGGDGFDGGEDGFGHAPGFVDDDEDVGCVDALEGGFVVVGGFASEGGGGLVAGEGPGGFGGDVAGHAGLLADFVDVAPHDVGDLVPGGGGGDDAGFGGGDVFGVEPPPDQT